MFKHIKRLNLFNNYHLSCFLLLYAFFIYKFPYLTYDANVFDEHGKNFLYAAYNLNIWDNLKLGDSG